MNIEALPSLSRHNREALAGATHASCYFCLNVVAVDEIESWADNGRTAKCPVCEVDALLPGTYSREQLVRGMERWFTGLAALTTGDGLA